MERQREEAGEERLRACSQCNKFRKKHEPETEQAKSGTIQRFANLQEAFDSLKKDLSSSSQALMPVHSQTESERVDKGSLGPDCETGLNKESAWS